MILKFSELIKGYGSVITTIFTIIATIGGAVLYVENNYANAADVKDVLKNQNKQIELIQRSMKDNLMFRLEYFDDRIKKLQEQKKIAEHISKSRSFTPIEKTPQEIQEEINELKIRRELTRKQLTE